MAIASRTLPREDDLFRSPIMHLPAVFTAHAGVPESSGGELAFIDRQAGVLQFRSPGAAHQNASYHRSFGWTHTASWHHEKEPAARSILAEPAGLAP